MYNVGFILKAIYRRCSGLLQPNIFIVSPCYYYMRVKESWQLLTDSPVTRSLGW